MASPKLVLGVLAAAALALVVTLLVREPAPVVVRVVSVEPSGIYDDTGEMWLVTLQMQRNDSQLGRSGPPIYVDGKGSAEARIVDRWTPIANFAPKCVLDGSGKHDMQFALPTTTVSCRLKLKWTRGRLVSGRLSAFAENLTAWPKTRTLLFKLVRGGGYPRYVPSAQWHQFTVEVPVSAAMPMGSK